MNKKGISPLIATVLLIGFTVALVFVVTTWGSGYLKDILSSTERSSDLALKCSPPYLDFAVNVDCDSGKFRVMNRGTETIVKLRVIPYPSSITPVEIEEEIISADTIFENLPAGATKLEIIAYILLNGEATACAQTVNEVTVNCVE